MTVAVVEAGPSVGSMQCPRCAVALTPHPHAGVVIDVCRRCHGSFLELGDARASLGESAEVSQWERTSAARLVGASALACPAGHGRMSAYQLKAPPLRGVDLELDVCAVCCGMWLDVDEASRLQQATRAGSAHSAHAAAMTGGKHDGVGWYLFGLFTAMPVEEFNFRRRAPVVCIALIAACCALFLVELMLDARGSLEAFIAHYAVVPTTLLAGGAPLSIVSHLFLHGGVVHLLGNMYFLYTFGDNVEDRVGRARFLGLYLAFGVAALVAQLLASVGSDVPLLGASGAISGLMGAYLALFPRARMYQVLLFVRFRVPAWVYLGVWVVLQAYSGASAVVAHANTGVAWFAHLGGFCAGIGWGLVMRHRFADGVAVEQ